MLRAVSAEDPEVGLPALCRSCGRTSPIAGMSASGPGFARIEGVGEMFGGACPHCGGSLTLVDGTYAWIGGAWRITPAATASSDDRALVERLGQPLDRVSTLSKSAVDRLGRRIAGLEPAADGDEGAFRAWLTDYEEARVRTSVAVTARVGLPVASRLKTRRTLIDKLTRDGLRLSQIQDVAGLRLTGNRIEQDRVAGLVASVFTDCRIVDRRERPSFGYRAVHLIGKVDALPVEVQVRTTGQHEWALLVERLADRWGRQIRYGHEPTEAGRTVRDRSRSDVMRYVVTLSDTLDALERSASGDDATAAPVLAAMQDLLESLTDQ